MTVTSRHGLRGVLGLTAAGAVLLALAGCGGSGLGAATLQESIAPTFANLYVRQQAVEGNPVPAAADLHARALCTKGVPSLPQSGAGDDWVCDITFLVAGPATPVTAIYDVTLQTDGCYAADGDGPASVNGARTVTGAGYRQRLNPLWLVDGCFDVD
jgi:hypothetical protein